VLKKEQPLEPEVRKNEPLSQLQALKEDRLKHSYLLVRKGKSDLGELKNELLQEPEVRKNEPLSQLQVLKQDKLRHSY
tara:strand:- start:279 stop:512 length:234 start_codon:yes stop_codon:yes gene_type:complete